MFMILLLYEALNSSPIVDCYSLGGSIQGKDQSSPNGRSRHASSEPACIFLEAGATPGCTTPEPPTQLNVSFVVNRVYDFRVFGCFGVE